MSNNVILKLFRDKLQLILCLLKYYYKTADVEDLHKLRVQIKKLEALIRLPQFEHLIHRNASIKKLFHQSGKIREKQVMLQIFLKSGRFDLSSKFVDHLQHEIRDAEKKFVSKRKSHMKLVEKFSNQNFQISQQVTKQQFLDYYKMLALNVRSKFAPDHKKVNLHEVRKILKELMYNIEVLNRQEVSWLLTFIRIDLLDNLQEKLGHWHDNVLLIKELTPFKNETQMNLILKKIRIETITLRNEIKSIGTELSIVNTQKNRRTIPMAKN